MTGKRKMKAPTKNVFKDNEFKGSMESVKIVTRAMDDDEVKAAAKPVEDVEDTEPVEPMAEPVAKPAKSKLEDIAELYEACGMEGVQRYDADLRLSRSVNVEPGRPLVLERCKIKVAKGAQINCIRQGDYSASRIVGCEFT